MDEKTIECPNRDRIEAYCSCPKADCPRHGLCCECIVTHKNKIEEPFIKRFPHCLRELVKEGTDDL